MALDLAGVVADLEDQYLANLQALAALPPYDVSDQGRSLNATGARSALSARNADIAKQLAQLGFPVGEIGAPFVTASRVRG